MSASGQNLVRQLIAAVADADPERARPVLHPYLHWTEGDVTTRGRTRVLALLSRRTVLRVPVRVELRDGQIYRWDAGD